MLEEMKQSWWFYMSELETSIIEEMLITIVESLTFKYTRQPEMLSLVPDRVEEVNLRLALTMKIINKEKQNVKTSEGYYETQDPLNPKNKMKFYRDVYTDEKRTEILKDMVESVYHSTYEECPH